MQHNYLDMTGRLEPKCLIVDKLVGVNIKILANAVYAKNIKTSFEDVLRLTTMNRFFWLSKYLKIILKYLKKHDLKPDTF